MFIAAVCHIVLIIAAVSYCAVYIISFSYCAIYSSGKYNLIEQEVTVPNLIPHLQRFVFFIC